jgi:hypothetical protein
MVTDPMDGRAAAIKRLSARRDFATHVIAYVVINSALVAIWLVTGMGYFWPGWVIGIWGAGLAIHAWETFGRRPITEEEIRREIDRQRGSPS